MPILTIVLACAVLTLLILLWVVLARAPSQARLLNKFEALQITSAGVIEHLERMRADNLETARLARTESASALAQFQESVLTQLTNIARLQNEQLSRLITSNERHNTEMRTTLKQELEGINASNAQKLDEMRSTVDEKLNATLEQRLGASFRLVSDRLEQVHRGLGEMQVLAAGVGDLKKLLMNVKTRGAWGEVQLGALLEQLLTPDQYAKNVAPIPNSRERVEFAIRLPGSRDTAVPVWLPIDAKFPCADYEQLLEAQDRADTDGMEAASRALEARIRQEAKKIAEKYLAPPHTTDFGLLFLPTEGLYAEVLRRPGLTDLLQRDYRVSIVGPTTLTALLNSLQMGFRTLAIEKRSSEVWQVLSAVKSEFVKFGDTLARTKSQLETVARSIEDAQTRTRVMHKKLQNVEVVPAALPDPSGLLADPRSSSTRAFMN